MDFLDLFEVDDRTENEVILDKKVSTFADDVLEMFSKYEDIFRECNLSSDDLRMLQDFVIVKDKALKYQKLKQGVEVLDIRKEFEL